MMSKSRPLSELDKLLSQEELAMAEKKAASMLFSMQITELMLQAGKTKEQLLTESELTPEDFANIEHSGLNIPISVLNKYVQALGGKLPLTATNSEGDVTLCSKL